MVYLLHHFHSMETPASLLCWKCWKYCFQSVTNCKCSYKNAVMPGASAIVTAGQLMLNLRSVDIWLWIVSFPPKNKKTLKYRTKSCLSEKKKGKWWRRKVIKIWREVEETGSRRRMWSNRETIMSRLRRWSYIMESLNWISIMLCDIKATLGICREQHMCIQREETARAVNYLGVLWVLHVKWMWTKSFFFCLKVFEYFESCRTFEILPSGLSWARLPQQDIGLCTSLFISEVGK